MAKKPSTKKPRCEYSLSITFGKDVFSGTGSTALEAVKATPVPVKIFSKGIIRMTGNGKSVEKVWMPVKMKRLFYPLSQKLVARQLEYLMK